MNHPLVATPAVLCSGSRAASSKTLGGSHRAIDCAVETAYLIFQLETSQTVSVLHQRHCCRCRHGDEEPTMSRFLANAGRQKRNLRRKDPPTGHEEIGEGSVTALQVSMPAASQERCAVLAVAPFFFFFFWFLLSTSYLCVYQDRRNQVSEILALRNCMGYDVDTPLLQQFTIHPPTVCA